MGTPCVMTAIKNLPHEDRRISECAITIGLHVIIAPPKGGRQHLKKVQPLKNDY